MAFEGHIYYQDIYGKIIIIISCRLFFLLAYAVIGSIYDDYSKSVVGHMYVQCDRDSCSGHMSIM